MKGASLRVIFAPDFSKWNPYQRRLAAHLAKYGVEVLMAGQYPKQFTILQTIVDLGIYDILHIHVTDSFLLGASRLMTVFKSCLFLGELLMAKALGIKLVRTIHNIVSHEREYCKIETFFAGLVFMICDGIIGHCSAGADKVMHLAGPRLKKKMVFIPHGHFMYDYKNDVTTERARAILKIAGDCVTILHFGTIRRYKGIPKLVASFKRIKAQDMRLIIAGKPSDKKMEREVKQLCQDDERIILKTGVVKNDEVQLYMNAADLVVTSFDEIVTSGSVILAMGFGKAVIAPALGCIPEILDEKGAILYDPHDERGLEKAMQMAVGMDLEAMGRYNLEQARKLDWDQIAERTIECYKMVLAQRKT